LAGGGLTRYEVVAGQVEEVEADPLVILFEGTYTGTGSGTWQNMVSGRTWCQFI